MPGTPWQLDLSRAELPHVQTFSHPLLIADELRRQADVFTDLAELQVKIGRNRSERPAPRERKSRYRVEVVSL